jgi:ABC-type glycerol-3-phosphate transport system substrate-binding protein
MTTTRRRVLALLGAGVAGPLGALAGCAGPGSTGSSGAPGAGEQPAPGAQPVSIRYPYDPGSALDSAFADEFNKRFSAKYPAITPQPDAWPDPDWSKRYEKWVAMAVAGTMPEIVWLCCTYLRPFMFKGLVAQLDQYIKRDWKPAEVDDFFKGPYEAMKIEGKQMGLPVYINTVLMFVNMNYLREAGLAYPDESWDKSKLADYAVKLNKRTGDRWGFDMGFNAIDRNIAFIWSNGGEPHDPKDGPVVTKLTYDDPKTIDALQWLHDLPWKAQVSPVRDDQRGGLGREDAFIAGKTAIYLEATGNAGNISTKGPANNLDWDFLPLTKGPGGYGARISTDGYMLDKQTKVAEQAWTLLRELTSSETQSLRAQLNRLQPPRKSAAATWEKVYEGKNAKLGRTMAETARADPRAFWKDADQVGAIVQKYMDATMIANSMDVGQALKQAMDEVRGYYAANQ